MNTPNNQSVFHAKAPAKVNLYLHVVGKRPDGYHLLESLIAFTDIYDEITITPAPTLSLTMEGEYAMPLITEADNTDNIILQAVRKLASYAGKDAHFHITLQKNIPVGAGMGGGSADAAAVIRLLADYWNLDITSDAIRGIALELGADVPVMLYGKTALIRGIGEVITPVKTNAHMPAVLVNPRIFLSTPAVFKQGVAVFSTPEEHIIQTLENGNPIDSLQKRRNDLETPAIALQPVIHDVLDILARQQDCLLSRMSGSGTTCFGLFPDDNAAQNAAKAIQKLQPGWWVKKTVIY